MIGLSKLILNLPKCRKSVSVANAKGTGLTSRVFVYIEISAAVSELLYP